MAKPIKTPEWLSDANAAILTSASEPTAGKVEVGWAGEERPANNHMNWLLHWICKWLAWLDNLGAEDLEVGSLSSNDDVTSDASVLASEFVQAGTGLRHTNAETHQLGPPDFYEVDAITAQQWNYNTASGYPEATVSGPNPLRCRIPVRKGEKITAVRVILKHNVATLGTMVACLYEETHAGVKTAKSDSMDSANVVTLQNIPFTGIAAGGEAVAASEQWYVEITSPATIAIRTVLGVEVDYTYPM